MVFATDNGVCHEADGSGGEPTASGRSLAAAVAAPAAAPMAAPMAAPVVAYAGAAAVYGAGRYGGSSYRGTGGVGNAGYPHVGPRGGQYRVTASGKKSYSRGRR